MPLLAAVAFVLATVLAPATLHTEIFDWLGHGKVSVTVPDGWSVSARPTKISELFNVKAYPKAGPVVSVQLSLVDPTPEPLKNEQLKGWLAGSTRELVKGSVEKVFDPKPLTLSQGSGLMVELTDASEVGKAAQPGKYKIGRSGVVFLDEHAMLSATILFNDPSLPVVEQAMSLLSSLRFERSTTTGQAPSTSSGSFAFTVPQSRVIVKVTDPSLRPDNTERAGGPSYFKLSRRNPQLILSGWLEPASSYKGLEVFWQSVRRSSPVLAAFAPTGVEMLRVGPWEVVAYEIQLQAAGSVVGAQANLRAERIQADTWIDLHLSTTSERPTAELRTQLLDALKQVEVVEK